MHEQDGLLMRGGLVKRRTLLRQLSLKRAPTWRVADHSIFSIHFLSAPIATHPQTPPWSQPKLLLQEQKVTVGPPIILHVLPFPWLSPSSNTRSYKNPAPGKSFAAFFILNCPVLEFDFLFEIASMYLFCLPFCCFEKHSIPKIW